MEFAVVVLLLLLLRLRRALTAQREARRRCREYRALMEERIKMKLKMIMRELKARRRRKDIARRAHERMRMFELQMKIMQG